MAKPPQHALAPYASGRDAAWNPGGDSASDEQTNDGAAHADSVPSRFISSILSDATNQLCLLRAGHGTSGEEPTAVFGCEAVMQSSSGGRRPMQARAAVMPERHGRWTIATLEVAESGSQEVLARTRVYMWKRPWA